jgi:hypothetical protein
MVGDAETSYGEGFLGEVVAEELGYGCGEVDVVGDESTRAR